MIFKVMVITLLSICAADNRIVIHKRANTQAFAPQRLSEYNIPISYKYGEVHHYSTANPITGQNVPNYYQRIQYAPLHSRIGYKNKNTASEYTKMTPTLSTITASTPEPIIMVTRKDHLEPRVPTGQSIEEQAKCFTPGHNVEVLPSASRSPGHNAVYRKFSDTIPRDKMNYMRPYKINPLDEFHNLDLTATTQMLPFELPHEDTKSFNQHYVLNPNVVGTEGPSAQKIKRQFSPYSKFHRLHLNIARVYSPGQVPQKAPVFADTFALNLGRLPVHSQAYIPPVFPLPNHKTLLYPTNENQRKYRFRLPL